VESARGTPKGGPEQFYPIYVHRKTGAIVDVGTPLTANQDASEAPSIDGCYTVLPVREKGDIREMNWGLTVPTLKERLASGYVKAVLSGKTKKKITIYYLTSGLIKDIEEEKILILDKEKSGAAIVQYAAGKKSNPTTQWNVDSHNAQSHGSDLIRELIPNREFPYPKSLFAVEDVLRILCGEKKDAVLLDFFSGSGTTAHAVMRLNKQDDGRRQCISVTNNEVGADEQKALTKANHRPGDPDWEKWGICDYITKPRIEAAITGQTPEGAPIKGDYKFTDEFPMADGFEENAELFTLTYETTVSVSHNRAFGRIAPLLWMRAGSEGRRIDKLPDAGWEVADTYGLLNDLDAAAPYLEAIGARGGIRIAYIVTNDDRRFQSVAQGLPEGVEAVRLYESYLTNFRFAMGR
jgi:adenine-specific DNA-methyltransferase